MPTIPEFMTTALAHHRAGRLREAESIYLRALEVDPGNHDAWHLLGVAVCQGGRHKEGALCIRRALEIKPDWAEAQYNLANSLRNQRKLPEAAACYQRSPRPQPRTRAGGLLAGERAARPGKPRPGRGLLPPRSGIESRSCRGSLQPRQRAG